MTRCINLDLSNIEYINTIKYILNDPYDIGKFKTPIEEREFNNKCSKLIVEKKEVFPFIMPQNIYLRNIKIKEYLEKNQNPIIEDLMEIGLINVYKNHQFCIFFTSIVPFTMALINHNFIN